MRPVLRAALVLLSTIIVSAQHPKTPYGLIPEGHWEKVKRITVKNKNAAVKKYVDSGRTLFIRWTNSSCEPCKKQAPAWNKLSEQYRYADWAFFGDVDLDKEDVRQVYGADVPIGKNGWPTIMYFNSDTSYVGQLYTKHTDMPLEDELGPDTDHLKEFVEEMAEFTICHIEERHLCTPKQLTFIDKWMAKPRLEIQEEANRLKHVVTKQWRDMGSKSASWAWHRKRIAEQILKSLPPVLADPNWRRSEM